MKQNNETFPRRIPFGRFFAVCALSLVGTAGLAFALDSVEDFAKEQIEIPASQALQHMEAIILEVGVAALSLSAAILVASKDEQ